jgi:hypothetical protein
MTSASTSNCARRHISIDSAADAPVRAAGIPDGNPPSGVASGYVWFDVMALLVSPVALAALRRRSPIFDLGELALEPGRLRRRPLARQPGTEN